MKSKLKTYITLVCRENFHLNLLLGLKSPRDHKPYIEYISPKKLSEKTHISSDCIEGSILNDIRDPIIFNFVLDKFCGFKIFCDL